MRIVMELDPKPRQSKETPDTYHLRVLLEKLGIYNPAHIIAREWSFYYSREKTYEDYIRLHQGVRRFDYASGYLRMMGPDSWINAYRDPFRGLKRAGFDVQYMETDDVSMAWSLTQDWIRHGVPIYAWFDNFYLPHPSNTSRYHCAHVHLIHGYENESWVWLHDAVKFRDPIHRTQATAARSSKNTFHGKPPVPVRNAQVLITPPQSPESALNVAIRYAQEAVDHFVLDPVDTEVMCGQKAIMHFANDLSVVEHERYIFHKFARGIKTVIEERSLGIELLRAAALESGHDHLDSVIKIGRRVNRSWSIVKNLLIKAYLTGDYVLAVPELCPRLREVCSMEEQFVDGLSQLLITT